MNASRGCLSKRLAKILLRSGILLSSGPSAVAFLLPTFLGCSSPTKPSPVRRVESTQAIVLAQAEEPIQSVSGEPQVAVRTAQEAKHLAEQHIALRKKSWGAAKTVSEQDSVYLVSFETPAQELRLLGPRIIIVNKASGAVNVQLRR